MITKQDKAKVAALVMSDTYRVLQQIAQDMLSEWAREKNSADEQFAFLKEAIGREKKIEGMSDFLKRLEELTKRRDD